MGSYARYSMNINRRQLRIDEDMYANLCEEVSGSGTDYSDVYLQMLEHQYTDYVEYKDSAPEDVLGRRNTGIAGLLGDRHGMLVSSGCCVTEYSEVYTIDYTEHLALIMAKAFDVGLHEMQLKINEVLEGKETSEKYLALMLLTNIVDIDKPTDVTIGDLTKIEEIREFLLDLIRGEVENDVPVLGDIDGINYLEYIEVDEEPTSALSIAIMLKLLKVANSINQDLVVEFYRRRAHGIVLSQDHSSISFAMHNELKPFVVYHQSKPVELKMNVYRR